MGKKSIETLVGGFVLLGMLGLVFLALKAANLGSLGGSDAYTLTSGKPLLALHLANQLIKHHWARRYP